MKNNEFKLILLAFIIAISSKVCGQDMLILPMPGQKITPATPSAQPKTQQAQPQTTTPQKSQNYSQPSVTPKQSVNVSPNRGYQNSIDANGMILPMPMQSSNQNSGQSNKAQTTNTPRQTSGSNIIAVPSKKNQTTTSQTVTNSQPLIAIPAANNPASSQIQDDDFVTSTPAPQPIIAKPAKAVAAETPKPAPTTTSADPAQAANQEDDLSSFFNDTDFPMPPDEFSASPDGQSVEDMLPPTQQETTVSNNTTGESITVYPKDTGSAIFMVMKSWKCDDYDAVKLIEQALEVYGKESDDVFQINGLNNLTKDFCVSIEEEDITLDELLDIIAAKSGNDWGADIPNRAIYIYPKGIKTESYVSWE